MINEKFNRNFCIKNHTNKIFAVLNFNRNYFQFYRIHIAQFFFEYVVSDRNYNFYEVF